MKQKIQHFSCLSIYLALTIFCPNLYAQQQKTPVSKQTVFKILASKDSLLFNAVFNTCDKSAIGNILGEDFVFYQDKGYENLTTAQPRKDFLENIGQFCNAKQQGIQMRREVLNNSLQVEVPREGEAIQTGVQHFITRNKDGKEQIVEKSKFSRTWKMIKGDWKLAEELDYLVSAGNEAVNPGNENTGRYQPEPYAPVSAELYQTITEMDSLYFDTYNTCNLPKMRSLMADSIEFYHDKGGLMTSMDEFIKSIQNNICGKVTRQPVPNSIEVYAIPGYGAVEIGYHRFLNHQEAQNGYSKPDKYIVIWQLRSGSWKITRVVSLH